MKDNLANIINSAKTGVVAEGEGAYDICVSEAVPITDEDWEHTGWYKQIVSKVNAINGNIRLYPRKVYEKALEALKNAGFPNAGEHPHPPSYKDKTGRVLYRSSIPNAAVKFRNAYIDENDNVWAEYKTLDTEMGRQVQALIDSGLPIGFSNRLIGNTGRARVNGRVVDVARSLSLLTWDVVLNPAESGALSMPSALTDDIEYEDIADEAEEDTGMNEELFSMGLEDLRAWSKDNSGSSDAALCGRLIELKEAEERAKKAEERLKAIADEAEEKERIEQMKAEAHKALNDEVEKLEYNSQTKRAILEGGKDITDVVEIADYIAKQKAFIDSVAVDTKLNNLGVLQEGRNMGRAAIIAVNDEDPLMPFVDGIMAEMDRELQKKDANFNIDNNLRKANRAIIDEAMMQLEREQSREYCEFRKALKDSVEALNDETSPAIGTTGQFAQSAALSLAILYQTWQDTKFLQLCMVEGFSGSTYKMPVEFQSYDLYTEDDFVMGELDGIETESVQTFMLEFGAQWLKRGFVVTKEAEREMSSGPLKYDVIARNAANIASRFTRLIDKNISTEMLARADEYKARRVEKETVAASELEVVQAGVNAPQGTNAACRVKLLCGNSSPIGAGAIVPPIVRPRVNVWLDRRGRKQQELTNEIIVKDSSGSVLIAGRWISSTGKIVSTSAGEAQYAVDYENSVIYFVDGVVSEASLPTVEYSYATNIAYFNLSVPSVMADNKARYYNQLLELIDTQKAYMGSAPRYVTPDFLMGSLNAMVPIRQAELFYNRALPDGTSLLSGEMYFGRRNNVELAEHNAPWAAGDNRLLLGKRNAVRIGMGSPYELEGPFPHIADGSRYSSAKDYIATQQIAVNTPLVIDERGEQYHPPFRTIKFYTAAR